MDTESVRLSAENERKIVELFNKEKKSLKNSQPIDDEKIDTDIIAKAMGAEEKNLDAGSYVGDLLRIVQYLQNENEKYQCVNKLLEKDIEDLHEVLERNVEDIYADFMKDYKIMRDELNSCYDENAELQKQVDELKKTFLSTCENCHLKKDIELLSYQKQQAIKDTVKEILQLLHDLGGCDTTDDWSKGWDKAIDTAYEAIKTRYGAEVE